MMHGVGELLAAVNDAVAHGVDLGHVFNDTVVVVGQRRSMTSLMMASAWVGHGNVLRRTRSPPVGRVLDVAVDADALAQALGQDVFGIGVHAADTSGKSCLR